MNEKIGSEHLSILNVSHNYYVAGGSDRCFLELEKLLVSEGHRVVPYCAASQQNLDTPYKHYFPRGSSNKKPTLSDALRFIYSHDARKNLMALLGDEKIDVAHLHIYYGKLTASILRPLKERGIPIVQSLHEYKLLCPVYTCISDDQICQQCAGKNFWHVQRKRCNRGSIARSSISMVESYVSKYLGAQTAIDHFIGVSKFMTGKMVEMGIPEEKISTIYNYVELSQFRPAVGPGNYLLYFGRLEKVKGVFTLLDAMALLPDARLVIAGSGKEEQAVRSYIAKHDLHNVNLAGFVGGEDLHDLIRGAICTVIPSEWYENCPMSVLESFALSRPVVGARIGGIPELIDHEIDGLIFEPGDACALASCLQTLVEDPEKAENYGNQGRIKVGYKFSAEHYYGKLLDVYRKVLN